MHVDEIVIVVMIYVDNENHKHRVIFIINLQITNIRVIVKTKLVDL